LSLFLSNIYGQDATSYTLIIKSEIQSESDILKQIKYKQLFHLKENLEKTKDSVISVLKERGYYTLLISDVKVDKNEHQVFLRLGVKTKTATIKINAKDVLVINSLNINLTNNFVVLKNDELRPFLDGISTYFSKNGQSFSKVKLINIKIDHENLNAELSISQSQKRVLDKTIINGYTKFPSSFLNHYLNLNKNIVFNSQEVDLISEKINQLKFASEIKKPEALYSKDSTILYLYLNKTTSNSFDGLINFTTEHKKLAFKGYLDLSLVNVFNYGEEINVNWKNTGNNKQEFSLHTKLPYLFNSKITSEVDFTIFRQDTTFVTTKSDVSFSYPLNKFLDFSILFRYENSNSTITKNNISDFKKNYVGFGVQYNSLKRNRFTSNLHTLFGKRTTNVETEQFLISFSASALIEVSKRIALFLKNKTSILSSNTYLENELFREGGSYSIRGFNDQSILTSKYTYINSEVRLISQNKTYLYSIQDIGLFEINNQNTTLYSLGLGYHFTKNTNSINISYTVGNSFNSAATLKSSLLSIKFLTVF
jgi:hypothetical protein